MVKVLERKTRDEMAALAAGLPSKSAKIRALLNAGFGRADTARFMKVRYQFVRNVELRAKEKAAREDNINTNSEAAPQVWAQIGDDGRIVIPSTYRKALGIKGGDQILMMLDGGEVRLIGKDAAIARAQALIAPYLKDESTSTEAFLAERRKEASREASRE